jgi:hypothetical protein
MAVIGTLLMTCRWCRSGPGLPCKYKGKIIEGKFHQPRVEDAELATDLLAEGKPEATAVGSVIGGRRPAKARCTRCAVR